MTELFNTSTERTLNPKEFDLIADSGDGGCTFLPKACKFLSDSEESHPR
jgi:hypothetical protein